MRTQTPVGGRKTRATKENKQLIDITKFNRCLKNSRFYFRLPFKQYDLKMDVLCDAGPRTRLQRESGFRLWKPPLGTGRETGLACVNEGQKEFRIALLNGRVQLNCPLAFEIRAIWALLDGSRETRPNTPVVKRLNAKIWLTKKESFHRSAKIISGSLTLIIRRPSLRCSQPKQDCTLFYGKCRFASPTRVAFR